MGCVLAGGRGYGAEIRAEFTTQGIWPGPLLGTGSSALEGKAIKVSGQHAFLAAATAGLVVLDISDPSNPFRVGGLDLPGSAYGVHLDGGYAYIANYSEGLQVVDITEPTAPVLVSSVAVPGRPLGIHVAGNLACIAAGPGGLRTVDVTDPRAPRLLGGVATGSGQTSIAEALDVAGGLVYLADGETGLNIIRVSDPALPVIIGRSPRGFHCVKVNGIYAYAGNFVINVSNPLQPREVLRIPGADLLGIDTDGTYLYGVDTVGDLRTYSVSNPTVLISSFEPTPNSFDTTLHVVVVNGVAHVSGQLTGGFGPYVKAMFVDMKNPTSPSLIGHYELSNEVWDVEPVEDFLYCASRGSGLLVLDLSDPTEPKLIGSGIPRGFSHSLKVRGNTAYLADNDRGLILADITDPTHPMFLSEVPSVGGILDVQLSGDYAFVGGNQGLGIVDIRDRLHPVRVGSLPTGIPERCPGSAGLVQGLDVVSNLAYLADACSGFNIVDVSNPTTPRRIVRYPPIPPFALGWTFIDDIDVRVAGPIAYVLAYGGVLGGFDISKPGLPVQFASAGVDRDGANGLEVFDGEIFVTGSTFTEVFELRNRTNFFRIGSGPRAYGMRKSGSGAFFASGSEGVVVAEERHVPYFKVSATSAGGGSVTVSPDLQLYWSNSVVTVTARPSPGWSLVEWFGDITGSALTNQLRVVHDASVKAVFGTRLSTTASAGGRVTVNPVREVYPYGATLNLSAVPDPGFGLSYWGNELTGTTNPARLTIRNPNPTVHAQFSPLLAGRNSLAVIIEGAGWVNTSPAGNDFATGQRVVLTAVPDPGQAFLGWSGDASGIDPVLDLVMSQNRVITARFTVAPRFELGGIGTAALPGSFRVVLSGPVGGIYGLDWTSDSEQWNRLAQLTNATGLVQFTEVRSNAPHARFYRAIVLP